MDDDVISLVKIIADRLTIRRQFLAVAESCTGGGLAKVCTDLPGSSAWFDRGFVTYNNLAKVEMLGVTQKSLDQFSAVSEAVVIEMTKGVLDNSQADWSIAVSGVAGPGGGSEVNPVGTVWLAWQHAGQPAISRKLHLAGDRQEVRRQSVLCALETLAELAQ